MLREEKMERKISAVRNVEGGGDGEKDLSNHKKEPKGQQFNYQPGTGKGGNLVIRLFTLIETEFSPHNLGVNHVIEADKSLAINSI
ncbi:hypothetical protein ElyMa_003052700 [Elysia marginata]|uniref:Uncharacterized protein n=1 Tax=Elysia marginata TaxID=1093978 RepID=A0AAV4II36_9GAST|nr:hypothetical protein ElyMa_003052700 [Elysia marginata]